MPVELKLGISSSLTLVRVIRDAARRARRKPTVTEAATLATYARWLDERRVLFVPYSVEVVECCLASLSSMKDETESALASLRHASARAALGTILDALRRFVDRWHGARTMSGRRYCGPRFPHPAPLDDEAEFFRDLGELRMVVRLMLTLLQEFEPSVEALTIIGTSQQSASDVPPKRRKDGGSTGATKGKGAAGPAKDGGSDPPAR